MGIVQRQAFWNVAISYTGYVIGALNQILLITNFLPQGTVGLTSVFMNINLIYTQFASLGVTNLLLRYFPFFSGREESKKRFISFSFALMMVGFCFATLAFILVKPLVLHSYDDYSADINKYYFPLILFTLFSLFFNFCEAYYWNALKTIFPSFLKDFLLRVLIAIAILLYAGKLISLDTFIYLFIFMNSVIGLIIFIPLLFSKEIGFRKWKNEEGLPVRKDLLRYSFYTQVNGIAGILVRSMDAVFVAAILGMDAAAVYTRGFFLSLLLQVPLIGMVKIVYPLIAERWKTNKPEEIEKIYLQASLNGVILGFFIFMMIFCNADQIYAMMPPQYHMVTVFVILGVARLFDLATGVNNVIIVTSKYYRVDAAINIVVSAITIVLNIILIRAYGLTGAAIANASAIVMINTTRCTYLWLKFGFTPFAPKMLKVLLVSIPIGIVFYFLPDFHESNMIVLLIDTGIRILLLFAVFAFVTYITHLSDELNAIADKALVFLRLKKR